MPTAAMLWQEAEKKLGFPVPSTVRSFCRRQGWVDMYLEAEEWEAKADTVEFLVQIIRNLKVAGVIGEASYRVSPAPASDGRWALLQELNATYHDAQPEAPGSGEWDPIEVSRVVLSLDTYPPSTQVILRFDSRLSLQGLTNQLRRLWPDLIRRGWTRRTRPLEKRALALVRFVCLGTPAGSTWRERRGAWNKAHPAWNYPDVRAFERDFRRAERQLSGQRYGLEWFYEPGARLDLPALMRLRAKGDRQAARISRRQLRTMDQAMESLRQALERRQRK